jgi:hypothetical protein
MRRRRLSTVIGALLLAGAPAAALAAATNTSVRSGGWRGTTVQARQHHGSVHFAVTGPHQQSVKGFAGDLYATCTKHGASQTVHITLSPTAEMTISGHRTFGFHGNFNIDDHGVLIAEHVAGRINGSFSSSTAASGTMSFTWTFDSRAPTPFPGNSCRTGTATFTAVNG